MDNSWLRYTCGDKKMKNSRLSFAFLFLLWLGFVLTAFFIVQRPGALQLGIGLLSTATSVLTTAVLLINAAGLGSGILKRYFTFLNEYERLLLGINLGLGILGLSGFGLATTGIRSPLIYTTLQVVAFVLMSWNGWLGQAKQDALLFWQKLRAPQERNLAWIPWFASASLGLSFILAFSPPADSFDALLYHLAVPEAWLKNGGLTAPTIIPPYWFPGLVEGIYTWGLALGSELVAQFLHLACGVLTILIIWNWVNQKWGNSLAWRTVAIIVSMPSLALLASWAYTDMMLALSCASAMYLLWRSLEVSNKRIWMLSGIYCGLAMGVKYTSFILPLTLLGWVTWKERHNLPRLLRTALGISIPAAIVASPWYIRNWIWMENPVYPFVFGGKYWDSFLNAHYAQAGTGIGWSPLEIFLLPLNVTLGHHDANFFDGRIGPVWLILFPVAIWTIWLIRYENEKKRLGVLLPALFSLVSMLFWMIGVINTSALWQSRLLFPGLMLLAPLMALAWEKISLLDSPKLKVSFILRVLIIGSMLINLLDFGLFVLVRNPLAVSLGIVNRQEYFDKIQPNYADALKLVNTTPDDSRIYFLFEPRSYQMPRFVMADPINTNLAHDFYLFETPDKIVQAWRSEGYTHVLYQHAGEGLIENPEDTSRLFALLEIVEQTPNTTLYHIPAP